MLFAGLQGETQGRVTGCVFGEADEASRKPAFVVILGREKSGVGTTIPERDTEALCAADYDVRAEFPGWLEQSEGEKIGRHDKGPPGRVDACGKVAVVVDFTVCCGILHEGPEIRGIKTGVGPRTGDDAETKRFRARP